MKKNEIAAVVICIIVILIFGILFAATGQSEYVEKLVSPSSDSDSYVVGIATDSKPFAYIDENGKLAGFEYDLMNLIAKAEGIDVTYKVVKWQDAVDRLLDGDVDIIYSSVGVIPEREKAVLFTEPYWVSNYALAVPIGNKHTHDELFSGNIYIATVAGTSAEQWLIDNCINAGIIPFEKMISYTSLDTAITEMKNSHNKDGAVLSDIAVLKSVINGKNMEIIDVINVAENFAAAVRQDETELYDKINAGIAELKGGDNWYKLISKHTLNQKV